MTTALADQEERHDVAVKTSPACVIADVGKTGLVETPVSAPESGEAVRGATVAMICTSGGHKLNTTQIGANMAEYFLG